MLIAYWHFSFTVSDIERSVDFYTRIVGMELVHRQEQHNEYTARLVAFDNAHLKVAQLTIPGLHKQRSGHLLELVEYVQPQCAPTDTARCGPGSAPLAFQGQDGVAGYRRLKGLRARCKSAPQRLTGG